MINEYILGSIFSNQEKIGQYRVSQYARKRSIYPTLIHYVPSLHYARCGSTMYACALLRLQGRVDNYKLIFGEAKLCDRFALLFVLV